MVNINVIKRVKVDWLGNKAMSVFMLKQLYKFWEKKMKDRVCYPSIPITKEYVWCFKMFAYYSDVMSLWYQKNTQTF